MTNKQKEGIPAIENIAKRELSKQQRQLVDAYQNHDKVIVTTGHGTGCTSCLSWILINEVVFNNNRVITIASTTQNTQDIFHKIEERHIATMLITKTLLNNAAIVTVYEPEKKDTNFSGKQVYLLDNASALQKQSIPSHNTKVVMVGVPIRSNSHFHNISKDTSWKKLCFSAEDSPFVDKSWVSYVERNFGRDSAVFKKRVLGEFPETYRGLIMTNKHKEAVKSRNNFIICNNLENMYKVQEVY